MFQFLQFMTITSSSFFVPVYVGHVWKSFLWFPSKSQETYRQKFQLVCYISHFYLDLNKINDTEFKM